MTERVKFLIVGTPRSGTTLVQRLACELEGVRVPRETYLLSEFAVRIGRADPFPWYGGVLRAGLGRYVALPELEGTGPDPDLLYDALNGQAESILDLLDVIVGATAPSGGWLHGEKTPDHLQWARLVAAARQDLKLICVVRDPRAVALSQRETPWGTSNLAFSAIRWVIDQREVRHLQRTFTDRVLIVRYEDVAVRPDQARTHIGRFLGVNETAPTPVADTLYRSSETWKSLATGEIRDARAERWRADLTPAAAAVVDAVANREMSHWGYQADCRAMDGWTPNELLSTVGYLVRRSLLDLFIRHALARRCGLATTRRGRGLLR